jgi:hypothetical protein
VFQLFCTFVADYGLHLLSASTALVQTSLSERSHSVALGQFHIGCGGPEMFPKNRGHFGNPLLSSTNATNWQLGEKFFQHKTQLHDCTSTLRGSAETNTETSVPAVNLCGGLPVFSYDSLGNGQRRRRLQILKFRVPQVRCVRSLWILQAGYRWCYTVARDRLHAVSGLQSLSSDSRLLDRTTANVGIDFMQADFQLSVAVPFS